MPLPRVRIIVIASVIIAVALLKKERKKKQHKFAGLATCQCGTSVMLSSNCISRALVVVKTLQNDRCG